MLEERAGLVPHGAMATRILEAVAGEIGPRPVEVGVGEVDARGLGRASGGGVHRKAAGVAEEVEEPLSCRLVANQRPRDPVVEEQSRIDVVGEVAVEGEAPFVNRDHCLSFGQFLVLLSRPLPPPCLEKRAVGGHGEFRGSRLDHPVEPDFVLDLGPLVRPVILRRMQPAGVPVDRQRDLGDVAVVDAKGLDPLAAGPLREVLEPFGEPAAEVTNLVGSRARARPAGAWRAGRSRFVVRAVGAGTVRVASPGSFATTRLATAHLLRAKSPRLGILAPIPAGGGCAERAGN